MSEENEAESTSSSCATCGIEEIDNIKLKSCDDCDLVRYCSEECQTKHKSEHEEACKKRAAELRDELLFKQPESTHLGDCPICFLPLSLSESKCTLTTCCSEIICNGCDIANKIREVKMRLENKCPFCREPAPSDIEGGIEQRKKRIKANDPVAIREEGTELYKMEDHTGAFEWYTKAAKLGDVEAHVLLARMYYLSIGFEKDKEKEVHHLEEAAIGGHPYARYLLGHYERNRERAVKHWVIAAAQGEPTSIKRLMDAFKDGDISKVDLAAALRAHQAAVDATKSQRREEAEEFERRFKFR